MSLIWSHWTCSGQMSLKRGVHLRVYFVGHVKNGSVKDGMLFLHIYKKNEPAFYWENRCIQIMMCAMGGINREWYFLYIIYNVREIDYYCRGNRVEFPPETGGSNASIGGNVSWGCSGLVVTANGEKLFLSLIGLCVVLLSGVVVLQVV